jgi:hypothetical protein
MIIDILNKKLTGKDGKVYEMIGPGRDYAQLSLHGRMKGDRSTSGVCGPMLTNIQEKIMISRGCADGMRRMAGYGKKPRSVWGSDGYIWLPDFMIFDEPYKILRWAADPQYTHFKELHEAPPDPPCFPDWKADEHGFEVCE